MLLPQLSLLGMLGGGAPVSFAVASATESSADASLSERYVAVDGSSSETYAVATLTERISAAVGSSSESHSTAALAERINAVVGSSSEAGSAATLAERVSGAVAASSEASSSAGLSERVAAAVGASGETASSASLTERVAAVAASGAESYSGQALAERLAVGVTATSETHSAAELDVLSPPFSLGVEATGESYSDAALNFGAAEVPATVIGGNVGYTRTVPTRVAFSVASTSESLSDANVQAVVRPAIWLVVGSVSVADSAAQLGVRAVESVPQTEPGVTAAIEALIAEPLPIVEAIPFAVVSECATASDALLSFTAPRPWAPDEEDDIEDILLLMAAL